MLRYHLHLHGQLLPSFKRFYNSRLEADIAFIEIITEHFPFFKVKDQLARGSARPEIVYQQIIERGATITEIDTIRLPNYQSLFLEMTLRPVDTKEILSTPLDSPRAYVRKFIKRRQQ